MQANRRPKENGKGTIMNNDMKNRSIHVNVKMHDCNTNQLVQRLVARQDS